MPPHADRLAHIVLGFCLKIRNTASIRLLENSSHVEKDGGAMFSMDRDGRDVMPPTVTQSCLPWVTPPADNRSRLLLPFPNTRRCFLKFESSDIGAAGINRCSH
ncbi:hypothetical protein FF011L_34790 [Roseimaritima multifibrata]|uniref:Uncharacterized protein n=1 Tax=Roseimaritima multifibrata TaxID=1930274 RepID=A0A517MIH9_9BACT|nr:hypothetical protein FF011L_34790 [Roseimaritima multifibrata]